MRIIATLILLCLLPCQALFAGKISGTVTDTNGKPLPFASVFVQGSNKGTSTNAEGHYSLTLVAGEYKLICQYVGYTRQEKKITITITSDLTVDFSLSLQELTLGEVVLGKGEDPAYEIIRQSIRKRKYYLSQLDRYRCEVYTKGQMRLRGFPKKVLGQKKWISKTGIPVNRKWSICQKRFLNILLISPIRLK